MKVLITGSSGLIGSSLCKHLERSGHTPVKLVRNFSLVDSKTCFYWNPSKAELDTHALKEVEGIIHLAGENIAKGRWTHRRKQALIRSRVDSTRLLVEAIESMSSPPSFMLNASAIGIYGDTGERQVVESEPAAHDFLGELGSAWENALSELDQTKTRSVAMRFGLVLSPKGGALKSMLPAFRMGGGAIFGSGRQFVSWTTLDDALRMITTLASHDGYQGPVNCMSPHAVRFETFAKTLGGVLHRPVFLKLSARMVGFIFGEMGKSTLLKSCRAHPQKLLEKGFSFQHPEIEPALRHLLNR
jgi:uncharacterized protein (TIGR01777 family)